MKADFLSPRAGMGGAFFVDGFQRPEPELVETVRRGIEAHKRSEQERNARWIAHCVRLLNEGETNA